MKKLFLLFATLLGSVGVSAYDFEYDGIQYTITSYDNREVAITGCSDYFSTSNCELYDYVYDDNNICWYVRIIESSAFKNCSVLESITIHANYTIRNNAFAGCSNLKTIVISDWSGGTLSFEAFAFSNCTKLENIVFSPLNDWYNNNPSSWSGAIIDFGEYSFQGCESLEQLIIPDKVTCSYNYGAFAGCTKIKRIELGKIKSFYSSEWATPVFDCTSLEYIKSSNDVYWERYSNYGYHCPEGSNAVIYGEKGTGDSFVPKKLLLGCKNTQIPEGVTEIYCSAFAGCKVLTSIDFPNSITSIEKSAFQNCTSLASIGNLSACTSIKNDAFNGCTSLSSIGDLPVCTYIGNQAFSGCTNLSSIGDFSACTYIGSSAFSGCTNLMGIGNLPVCTYIGDYAFYNCSSLQSFMLPKGVSKFDKSVLSGCHSLSSLTVESGNEVYDSRGDCNAIINTSTNELVLGCKNTIIPTTVTSIGVSAFGSSGITSISVPNSVTTINNSAFANCSELETVTMANSVSTLGTGVFSNCVKLRVFTGMT